MRLEVRFRSTSQKGTGELLAIVSSHQYITPVMEASLIEMEN